MERLSECLYLRLCLCLYTPVSVLCVYFYGSLAGASGRDGWNGWTEYLSVTVEVDGEQSECKGDPFFFVDVNIRIYVYIYIKHKPTHPPTTQPHVHAHTHTDTHTQTHTDTHTHRDTQTQT